MRLAEELLNETAEDSVEDEEQAEHRPRTFERAVTVGGDAQDDEQHHAFERRLVELTWMARLISRAGEHHGPGRVAHAADHLGIDEIGDAAEEQSERRRSRGDISERQ